MTEHRDPAGGFVVTFEQREGYVRAFVKGGIDNADVSRRYWSVLSDFCRTHGVHRVLVVESFETPSSLVDVYLVASEIPRLMKGVRIAFVDEAAEHYEENVFGETVAINRGATGRVFRSEEEAITWLTA